MTSSERFHSYNTTVRRSRNIHKKTIYEKLKLFFEDDQTSVALTNRIDNELSHLEHIFDRSMRPIEIPEIPKVANYVLDRIKDKDREQFMALLESIGENKE
jgi:hypothetical protein